MPDFIAQNFHPNEKGHNTIASFGLTKAMDLRASVLGVNPPACELIIDKFTCWADTGSRSYATASVLDKSYKDFCNTLKPPAHTLGWKSEKTYQAGSVDEHTFKLQLSNKVTDYNKTECLDSLARVVHRCNTDKAGVMNWKQGGQHIRGEYTYELNLNRTNRPWPMPTKPVSRCEGWYKFLLSTYTIEGGGFASWDSGSETLRPSQDGCYGLGTTKPKFMYYNSPTKEGYEWKYTFRTPIFVRHRCFTNNKVIKGAGGDAGSGCKGNDG
ncbi:hypothetical protein B0T19DRAFT_135910 [Cercophora scortea]|uniref:Uncharacterized protein n=1 Tax=Cercophora scortea TaxID=314031 RepID=A0AAE0IYU6_9PEZI|nr:hypothetical protein B0T19DRAFT_135910 [Cercophora scortea]